MARTVTSVIASRAVISTRTSPVLIPILRPLAPALANPDVSKQIMEFDLPFLIRIIDSCLNPEEFIHCKYVHHQIRRCERNSISDLRFESLKKKFECTH